MLSGRLQDELIHRELNFVIDTVLKSEASAEVIATRLDRAEYTYDVMSVQITEDISKASIRERWEQPYRTFLQVDQTEGTCFGWPSRTLKLHRKRVCERWWAFDDRGRRTMASSAWRGCDNVSSIPP